ncbi:MAG: anti-anti-sigma factor [Actinoplanes sp.]
MPSEVRHLVDRGQTYPLVRLSGVLDAETAPAVRLQLLDVLAAQPEAVVVDVSDLRPDAVGALRDLRTETLAWPAAQLLLCGVAETGVDDAAAWQSTGWPVWPDVDGAFASLGRPDPGSRLSVDLEPQVGAARQSRELIAEACARWGRPDLAGPGCIVVTEMVNNVISHAKTSMVVLLAAHGAGLSVAVRDWSPVAPTYSGEPVPVTSYGGRGMLLIDSVAGRWGNLVLADGKVVWAVLGADGQSLPPARDQRNGTSMTDPARG